jgi:hypothetical protein
MPSPITRSPLKVVMKERGTQMTATDPGGAIVLEGARSSPARAAATVNDGRRAVDDRPQRRRHAPYSTRPVSRWPDPHHGARAPHDRDR